MSEPVSCSVEGCKRPCRAKGFCGVHFRKWRRGELKQKPRYKICGEEACRKPLFKFGKCEGHFKTWLAGKKGGVPEKKEPAKEENKPV